MKRVAAAIALAGATARADPPARPEAIDVDFDRTPPGQAELAFDGGAPIGAWAAGVTLGYLDRPVTLRTPSPPGGTRTGYPVDHRATATLGAAVALGDHVIVDARMPFAHQVGTRLQGFGDDASLRRFVLGDLDVGLRVRVADAGPVHVFLRGDVTAPTGDDFEFAGDASWSVAWLGIARAELPHAITVSGTAGFHLRAKEIQIGDTLFGDEIVWGIGATFGIPPFCRLWCKPEQLRATLEFDGVVGDRVSASHDPSPAEVKVGLVGRVRPSYAIAVRVGTHLDDQAGAPELRATIDLVYQRDPDRKPAPKVPPAPEPDDTE